MRLPHLTLALAALLCASRAGSEAGESIVGIASVIDGDTIEIHGRRIRFHGIDAPEASQWCTRDGDDWPCGRRAAQALHDFLGRRPVECAPEKVDRYGRIDARCSVGTEDVEAWMVRQGWALAYRRYSSDYVDAEAQARAEGRDIWSGTMLAPERYRREQEALARSDRAITDCARPPPRSSASAPDRKPGAESGCGRN